MLAGHVTITRQEVKKRSNRKQNTPVHQSVAYFSIDQHLVLDLLTEKEALDKQLPVILSITVMYTVLANSNNQSNS